MYPFLMKKEKFTLVELIVVIAILVILVNLVLPNSSNVRTDAYKANVLSNIRSIQTAVDMYYIDHNSSYPAFDVPTIEKPQLIDFELLHPRYLKRVPPQNEKYWVDFSGKVWDQL